MKKRLCLTALVVMLLGSSLSVYAAPEYMADGAVFDAEWYLEQNPDIAAAFPAGTSAEILYQHYMNYGIKEGRTPYNTAAFDPTSVQPNQNAVQSGPLSLVASNNKDAQNYRWNWASTVKSYLYENQNGGLTRVEYDNQQIVAEDYDNTFKLCASYNIPMELSIWGGFFAGETYNFVIFGQENLSQNNNTEVVRVVKYSKDWQRLGQASLYGANTTVPFDGGSLRCAEYGDYLYIRTCHKMYASKDGKNHQANMTLAVRQSDMTLTDSYHIVMNSSVGYVSHSFNQFVLVDQNKNLVTLDHGDAYPRSLVLMRYNTAKAGGDKFSGSVSNSSLVTFSGSIGDNYTGTQVGGFAETANGYVTAYTYDGGTEFLDASSEFFGEFLDANLVTQEIYPRVYLGYTSKNGLSSTVTKITDAMANTPVLVSTGLSGGYLMWTDGNDTFYYATYADGGTINVIGTANAALSDCQPICHNGEVVWYVTNHSVPTFYKIGVDSTISAVTASK